MVDIIIIGAGTAGLSAAIYGVRSGKKVVVFEEKTYGGQIVNTPEIENYPGIKHISGFEFATNLYEQAVELGANIKYEKVISIVDKQDKKVVVTSRGEYETLSVIIATGAKNRKLGVEGEESYIGRGLSYCATCDGAFFRGKEVAVVGGGNTALSDALFLSGYCKTVYIIHRRDEFRGEEALVERIKNRENIKLVTKSVVKSLKGNDTVEGVVVENVETKETMDMAVNGVFVAIGHAPDNEAFSEIVDLDVSGYIVATEDCKTNVKGVFTAGDCRTKTVRQLATAASDGAIAAIAACEYIG